MQDLEKIKSNYESTAANLSAEKLIIKALDFFGKKVVLSSSFSLEDQVLLDMLCKYTEKPEVFTLDTGRLPQETYNLIQETKSKYKINIKIIFPDKKRVEKMVNTKGPNLFYDSVENRKLCCKIRKIEPLKNELAKYSAWICGLRSQQSVTREKLQKISIDYNFGLIKISPIADWTIKNVWDYIEGNNIPYNKLHDQGYPSIGCECCTRPVIEGEDIRAGRWWWEQPEHKECGLHLKRKNEKQKV